MDTFLILFLGCLPDSSCTHPGQYYTTFPLVTRSSPDTPDTPDTRYVLFRLGCFFCISHFDGFFYLDLRINYYIIISLLLLGVFALNSLTFFLFPFLFLFYDFFFLSFFFDYSFVSEKFEMGSS